MVVRVRIKRGRIRRGKSTGRGGSVSAFRRWLSPASAVALLLALWRLGSDLNWTGRFAISQGLFSHWQVWLAMAVLLQVVAWMLQRHGRGGGAAIP
jgi:hypothetical protein